LGKFTFSRHPFISQFHDRLVRQRCSERSAETLLRGLAKCQPEAG
jgi:hypothetical protein